MSDSLVLCAEQGPWRIEVVKGARVRVGRREGDMLIPHQTVGSRQAILYFADAACMIEDADSPSGTFVNEMLIRKPTVLNVGDKVRLGGVTFVVEEG